MGTDSTKNPIPVERQDLGELKDLKGLENIELQQGELFKGWYFSKTPIRKVNVMLSGEVSYQFTVCDFNYKFVMPSKVEFMGGIISYTEAERLLGLFRFPCDENGNFCTPMSAMEKVSDFVNLSEEELTDLLSRRKPLVFDAFRIPQFGFEYFNLSDHDLQEISKISDEYLVKDIKFKHTNNLEEKMASVLYKIRALPNFLLILQNTLDKNLNNLKEVSVMTESILREQD